MSSKKILGISAYYHDSAAALISDGKILAAAEEERFTRKKHDAAFPEQAIRFGLQQANIRLTELDAIVFYDKPFLTFDRLLETYLSYAPRGVQSFIHSMPSWLTEKLVLKSRLKKYLANIGSCKVKSLPPLLFTEHHQSHAASAFYPSPFSEAAVLCLDGVGEWATTSAWTGQDNRLTPLWHQRFPHSLGLLYSAFTYFCGFRVNSGEYKLMGLAPYGEPRFQELILNKLVSVQDDGSFHLDLHYFDFCIGSTMTNQAFADLFGGPPRAPESAITQRELDLAASIQAVTEDIILRLATTLKQQTQADNLCLAGGVALNCTANGKLRRAGIFNDIWVQPAAGDAGGAIGAALAINYQYFGDHRQINIPDGMHGCYLGPAFDDSYITELLNRRQIPFTPLDDSALFTKTAQLLGDGNVIGWFQGRMEFGPRALGNRSILADARNPAMQSRLNLKIKFRESFRPFAPAILSEQCENYFDLSTASPYMLFTEQISPKIRNDASLKEMASRQGIEKLKVMRSTVPAVTHIDMSARVQTVHLQSNSKLHRLLSELHQSYDCPLVVNTSFNVRGEPIVCTPDDALDCFLKTGMDYLVLGNALISKQDLAVLLPTHRQGDDL